MALFLRPNITVTMKIEEQSVFQIPPRLPVRVDNLMNRDPNQSVMSEVGKKCGIEKGEYGAISYTVKTS